MPSSFIVTTTFRRIRSRRLTSIGSLTQNIVSLEWLECDRIRQPRLLSHNREDKFMKHTSTRKFSIYKCHTDRLKLFKVLPNFVPKQESTFYSSISDIGNTTNDDRKSNTNERIYDKDDDLSTTSFKGIVKNRDTVPPTSEIPYDPRNSNNHDQNSNPSFKVSRVSYKTGVIETVNLDTTTLLKEASVYARDLFFTLNLTSRQERYQQQRVHVNGSISSNGNNKNTTQSASTYHNHSASTKNAVRRTVSIIQSRKKKIILLSFGTIRAVAGLQDVLLFDAHLPNVRDFAHELRNTFQSKNNSTAMSSTSESSSAALYHHSNQNHGSNINEPYELLFLECVLRDTVDSYHRRLRLFEPIVDSILEKVDKNDITSPDAVVHQIGPLKDALQSFEMQVRQSLECLDHLLTHDDEMLALLLTEQNAAQDSGGTVDFARHEHVELLLGVYARQISNVSMEITYLLQRLQSKQEFVTLALSGYRNRMVQMNVHLSIAALSLGLSTTVAGFFGMNLLHGMESSTVAFGSVVFVSCTSSLLTWMWALNHLSGTKMRRRAKQRLDEMETLTSALSDMCALDHTLKTAIERGESINKEQFRVLLQHARNSRVVTSNEVDLLFEVFDKIKDGSLTADDFNKDALMSSTSSTWGILGRKTK